MSIEAMKRALEDIAAYYPNSWAADRAKAAIQQAEAQQPAQSVNEKHFGDFELLVVTTAYEQGFGHAFRTELSNPYAPATNAYKAWDMGRSAGKRNGQPQQPATGEPVAVQALEAIAKGDLGGIRYLESSEAMVIRMQSIAATAIKSIIHGSQGALKCMNGTQNTLPQQQEAVAVGDTKTPKNGFQGPLAQDLSTKAGASQVEPFAHICIVNTKDAGPTKFFTAPSDPRAIPVYTHPAPSVPATPEPTVPQEHEAYSRYLDATTPEPVVWNSIQIASWIGSQLMHEPSMFERAAVCKFVRSLGRHPTLLKHSPKIHPAAPSGLGDSKRLDYLQDRGATIDLIAGVAAFYPMRFRVGGLHSSANIDVRAAIDAAILAAKERP